MKVVEVKIRQIYLFTRLLTQNITQLYTNIQVYHNLYVNDTSNFTRDLNSSN